MEFAMNPFTVNVKSIVPDNTLDPTNWSVTLEFQHTYGPTQTVPITVFKFELGASVNTVRIINHAIKQAIIGQVTLACNQRPQQDWFDGV